MPFICGHGHIQSNELCDKCREKEEASAVALSDGLDCHLCAKMTPTEVYKKWGFDYEARYKATCKEHRPLMLERMENGLNKLKELLAD